MIVFGCFRLISTSFWVHRHSHVRFQDCVLDVKKQMWQVGVIYSNKYQQLVYGRRDFDFPSRRGDDVLSLNIEPFRCLLPSPAPLFRRGDAAGSRKTDALFISVPAGLVLQQSKLEKKKTRPGKLFYVVVPRRLNYLNKPPQQQQNRNSVSNQLGLEIHNTNTFSGNYDSKGLKESEWGLGGCAQTCQLALLFIWFQCVQNRLSCGNNYEGVHLDFFFFPGGTLS